MTDFVQPIMLLVSKTDPAKEVDAIAATAAASVGAYVHGSAADEAAWSGWLSDAFTKSVRRADDKTFEKTLNAMMDLNDPYIVQVGRARAAAFAPIPADVMPKPLAKLQVSGTSLPAGPSGDRNLLRSPTIVLNLDLNMSTGKAAAQAAHAYFAWHLRHGSRDGAVPAILFAGQSHLEELAAEEGSVVIRDAGRTEIAPNSLTAVATSVERGVVFGYREELAGEPVPARVYETDDRPDDDR